MFHITEKENGLKYFSQLELHTIELSKFSDPREELTGIAKKVKTMLDIWVTFLSRHDLLRVNNLPSSLDIPEVNKAIHILEIMNLNSEERDLYDKHIKWLRDESCTLKKAKEDRQAEGREEEKIVATHESNKQGIDISVIESATGLSKERLMQLQNNMSKF